jgi:uncharacterized metal-binding protein YceD (DUF177 family)
MIEPIFHFWVDPAEKGRVRSKHQINATAEERGRLAKWLGIPAVSSLTAEMTVERTSNETARATGRLKARVMLECGISLEPYEDVIQGEVDGTFAKPAAISLKDESKAVTAEIDIAASEDEPGEWRPAGIDIGMLVAESLSLFLPDFPRKPGAQLDFVPEDDGSEDEEPSPFAALARLKKDG